MSEVLKRMEPAGRLVMDSFGSNELRNVTILASAESDSSEIAPLIEVEVTV